MDIDLLKSTPQDDEQIEMMLMTMHMDKPTSDDVCPPYDNTTTPMMSFSGGDSFSQQQQFTTPQTTISFSNNNNNDLTYPSYSNNNSSENGITATSSSSSHNKQTSMAAMREMIFRIAAMQPIYIDPEAVKLPKRRNVRISKDPQSVAARHRRERISERIRILQRLVPGGTKMDTASMLDEAIHYVKFLKSQVQSLERSAINNNRPFPTPVSAGVAYPVALSSDGGNGYSHHGGYQLNMNDAAPPHHNVQHF